jgi:hypothetical protein
LSFFAVSTQDHVAGAYKLWRPVPTSHGRRCLQAMVAGAHKPWSPVPTSHGRRCLQAMVAGADKPWSPVPTSHGRRCLQAMVASAYKPWSPVPTSCIGWSLEAVLRPDGPHCNYLMRECPLLRKGSFHFLYQYTDFTAITTILDRSNTIRLYPLTFATL